MCLCLLCAGISDVGHSFINVDFVLWDIEAVELKVGICFCFQ